MNLPAACSRVTPEIERKTITIISKSEGKRRRHIRDEWMRRELGLLSREVYALQRQQELDANIERAGALRKDGKRVKDIAQEMGKSVHAIHSYLYRKK